MGLRDLVTWLFDVFLSRCPPPCGGSACGLSSSAPFCSVTGLTVWWWWDLVAVQLIHLESSPWREQKVCNSIWICTNAVRSFDVTLWLGSNRETMRTVHRVSDISRSWWKDLETPALGHTACYPQGFCSTVFRRPCSRPRSQLHDEPVYHKAFGPQADFETHIGKAVFVSVYCGPLQRPTASVPQSAPQCANSRLPSIGTCVTTFR